MTSFYYYYWFIISIFTHCSNVRWVVHIPASQASHDQPNRFGKQNCQSLRSFNAIITGLPVRPSHKMGFRSSAAKNGLPGEGRHEGLVPRNDVLTNGFIWFSLARTLARILFVPRLRSPWKTHKALRTWRRLFALFEAIRSWESLYNSFIARV